MEPQPTEVHNISFANRRISMYVQTWLQEHNPFLPNLHLHVQVIQYLHYIADCKTTDSVYSLRNQEFW